MIDELDNAKILMLSNKGHYGSIKIIDESDNEFGEIKVCYLAICKYKDDKGVYLFLCDENMSVEQDSLFDYIDEAIISAQRRSQIPIVWNYPDTRK